MLAKKVISPNIATWLVAVLPTLPLFIRTLTHEVNESSDHENWMQIPLQVWILFPWKRPWWVRFGMVLNDPKEDQSQNTMEEDLGYKDQKSETASSPARHFVIVAFAVPAMKMVWNRLEVGLKFKNGLMMTDIHMCIRKWSYCISWNVNFFWQSNQSSRTWELFSCVIIWATKRR